jgi:hypothetical protein
MRLAVMTWLMSMPTMGDGDHRDQENEDHDGRSIDDRNDAHDASNEAEPCDEDPIDTALRVRVAQADFELRGLADDHGHDDVNERADDDSARRGREDATVACATGRFTAG